MAKIIQTVIRCDGCQTDYEPDHCLLAHTHQLPNSSEQLDLCARCDADGRFICAYCHEVAEWDHDCEEEEES